MKNNYSIMKSFQEEASVVEFSCFVDSSNTTWHHCGLHINENNITPKLEFTASGAVCADPCKPSADGSFQWCKYVFWRRVEASNEEDYELVLSWDRCEGQEEEPADQQHATAGIVLACVLGVVVIMFIISYVIKCAREKRTKKDYEAARDREMEFM